MLPQAPQHNQAIEFSAITCLPVISLQPVDAGAARKTSHAVGQATKTVMSIMKQGELNSENIDDSGIDRLEI
ncbi:hypothetical protein V6N13_014873 [Hibiscus sabdariffa]